MSVVVPTSDVGNAALQTQIAAVQALVNAPTINPQNLAANQQLLDQLQQQLVLGLMANANSRTLVQFGNGPSFYKAATILSNGTINT